MFLPIIYLQRKDFMITSNKEIMLKGFGADDIVVIMIQGGFCGYCTKAKPEYINFASKMVRIPNVYPCTIQTDNKDCGDCDDLREYLFKQGVPSYVAFRGGRLVGEYNDNSRSSESLIEFVRNLQ